MIRARVFAAAFAVTAFLTACSSEAPTSSVSSQPSFQGGSNAGGGGGGGGGSNSTGTVTAGPPVAPTYVNRINVLGVVPAGFYYGTPTDFVIGGYLFKSAYLSSFKPVNGPIVVGACVSVSFYELDGVYMMTELKTLASSKCGS